MVTLNSNTTPHYSRAIRFLSALRRATTSPKKQVLSNRTHMHMFLPYTVLRTKVIKISTVLYCISVSKSFFGTHSVYVKYDTEDLNVSHRRHVGICWLQCVRMFYDCVTSSCICTPLQILFRWPKCKRGWKINAYRASTGNHAGKRPLGRDRHTWEHKTKIDLTKKEKYRMGVGRIRLTRGRTLWTR